MCKEKSGGGSGIGIKERGKAGSNGNFFEGWGGKNHIRWLGVSGEVRWLDSYSVCVWIGQRGV